MNLSSPSLLILLALPHVLCGCAAGSALKREPDAVTKHLRIYVEHGVEPLCAGDFARFERMFVAIGDAAGISLDGEVVDMYYWALDPDTGAVPSEAGCGKTSQGCYRQSSDTVHATKSSWDHELAHAVINRASPYLSDYLDEAFAEAFTDFPTVFPYGVELPSEQIDIEDRTLLSRSSGSHFVRWGMEEYGVPEWEDLDDLPGTETFERWTGVSVHDAEAQWLQDSPFAYPSILRCGGRPELPTDEGGFSFEPSRECGDPTVQSWGSTSRGGCFQFRPERTGIYRIDVEGLLGISRCLDEPLVDASEHHNGTFRPEIAKTPPASRLINDTDYVELESGTPYRACLSSSEPPTRMEATWVATGFSSP